MTLLSLAAAAVVRGGWLATALALGTPTVTTSIDAAAAGALHDRHVVVVPDGPDTPSDTAPDTSDTAAAPTPAWIDRARTAAVALAADEPRASRLSREAAGMRRHLDLGRTAAALLAALRLNDTGESTANYAARRLTSEFDALDTPSGSPARTRGLAAVAALTAHDPPGESPCL